MFETAKEKLQKRAAIIESCKKILDQAGSEKRGLKPEETEKFDSLMVQIDSLGKEVNEMRQADGQAPIDSFGKTYTASNFGELLESLGKPMNKPIYAGIAGQQAETNGIKFYNKNTLHELRNRIDGSSGMETDSERLSAGKYITGLITGNWTNRQAELRQLGTGAQGGNYLCPLGISSSIIEMALAKTRVVQAGAQIVYLEGKSLTIPRVLTPPNTEWKNENAAFSKSQHGLTFDGITLTPKMLISLCQVSIELAEDGLNMESVVEQQIALAIAQELDRAILNGGGANTPTGIAQTAGVLAQLLPDPVVSYAPFSSAHAKIEAENATPNAMIASSSIFGDLDALVSATDLQPLRPPESWATYSKLSSNQITDMGIMGDYTKLIIGLRGDVHLEMTRATDTAWQNARVFVRGYIRADCGLAHAKHFCVIHLTGSGSISPSSSASSSNSPSLSPSASASS